ncbi:hypothetical protein [Agrobacterium sp. FDAARGOS_525]|uniref:hypothetical protein n=1 Tax=Agrobacterium sp. FDAARGOS_525 TaxID=2420311 RepID=UPI00269C473F
MNGPSIAPAIHPLGSNSAADRVEFGTSADGFPVARIDDVLLGLISNGTGDFFLASAWRFTKPLAEARRHHFYRHDGRVADEAAFRLRAIETAEHISELATFARVQTRMTASTPWGGSQMATIYVEGSSATRHPAMAAFIFLTIEIILSIPPFAARAVGTKRTANGQSLH